MFHGGGAIDSGFIFGIVWRDDHIPWLIVLAMLLLCLASFAAGILDPQAIGDRVRLEPIGPAGEGVADPEAI